MAIRNLLSGAVSSITEKVEAFNDIALDKSTNSFRQCLGDSVPFEVIEGVQNYCNKLSTVLNSSLDDLACGVATIDNSKELLPAYNKDAAKIFSGLDEPPMGLFNSATEKASYLANGLTTSNNISSNDWIGKDVLSGGDTVRFTSGALGADAVNITKNNLSYNPNSGKLLYDYSINITNLQCGPNDGSSKTKDAKNVLEPVSGVFNYSGNKNIPATGTTSISLKSAFSSATDINSNATLNVETSNGQIVKSEFIVNNVSIGSWCAASDGLTSAQKEEINNMMTTNFEETKGKALSVLKSVFVTSSILADTLMDSAKDLSNSDKLLANLDAVEITNAVKTSIANSAISIVNGIASLDATCISTISNEITNASINNYLESNGIPGDIGKDCSQKFLNGAAKTLSYNGISPSAPGLDGVIDFGSDNIVTKSESLAYASSVMSTMNEKYESQVLSADCLNAVNSQYDVISDEIVYAQDMARKALF